MGLLSLVQSLSWVYVAAAVGIYTIGLVVYRLVFDPLAKFPGPKLAAVTRYYEALYDVVLRGQYTFKIAEMHKKYGPIIRISPYELHVSDPAFYDTIYRQEGRWDKYAWSYRALGLDHSTICATDHDVHRRRRAPQNAFFSKANVSARQEIRARLTEKLCGRVDEFAGERGAASAGPVEIGNAVSAFTRDVALEFLFGEDYGDLDRPDFAASLTSIFQSFGWIWRATKHISWVDPLMKAVPLWVVELTGDQALRGFLAFLQDMAQRTRNVMDSCAQPTCDPDSKASPHTIVHEMLRADIPPQEKTFACLSDDVAAITGASFETTAQTLRAILYHTYTNPPVLARLRTELLAARRANGIRDLDLGSLERLPFLTAVLMEGLRHSPGLATRLARIAPDRDLFYGRWRIPAGTPVGMTTLLMHRDPGVYPEPNAFHPERWMDIDFRRRAEKMFGPFSRGTRSCLGMYLAWAEMYMVVAAFVQRFDFEFDGTSVGDIEPCRDRFVIGTRSRENMKVFVKHHHVGG